MMYRWSLSSIRNRGHVIMMIYSTKGSIVENLLLYFVVLVFYLSFFICHFSSKIEYFCIFFYFHDEVKKDRNFILYNDHYLYFNYWSLLILWKMNFVSSILEWMSFNVELKSNKSRMFELIKVKKRKFKN